jgi:hypothetical protein
MKGELPVCIQIEIIVLKGTRDTEVCKRKGLSLMLRLYRRNVKLCDLY